MSATTSTEYLTPGQWWPLEGWTSLPVWLSPFAEGIQNWEGRWYVEVGTPAWDKYKAGPPNAPSPAPKSAVANAPDGTEDMAGSYTNDPALGVVPVGEPVSHSITGDVWRMPSRLIARLMPVGEVAPWIGFSFDLLPWAVWGLLAWVVWKRTRR